MKSPESRSFITGEAPAEKKQDLRYRLIVSDLEGILVQEGEDNVWRRLFAKKGILDVHTKLKKEYLNNRNLKDRMEWVQKECEALAEAKLTKAEFDEVINSQPLVEGAKEAFLDAHKMGFKTAIITGGIEALALRVQKEFKIDRVAALCDFKFDEQGIFKRGEFLPCDYEGKADFFETIAREFGVPVKESVYFGHSVNDRHAFQKAGLSVAIVSVNDRHAFQKAGLSVPIVSDRSEETEGAMVRIPTISDFFRQILLPTESASEKLAEGMKLLFELIERERETKRKEGKHDPIFVFIGGGTNSGKTKVIADGIKKKYPRKASTLSMDDYFRGRTFIEDMIREGKKINRDHPLHMDFELLRSQLLDLAQGKTIVKPKFDYKTGEKKPESETFSPNEIIIVEGNFALTEEMLNLESIKPIKVYADASFDTILMRRIFRDIKERAAKERSQSLLESLTVVMPMHREHVVPTKESADVIIINEYDLQKEANNNGPLDIQIKFEVNAKQMRQTLQAKKAEHLRTVHQDDLYFHLGDNGRSNLGEFTRIREEIREKKGRYYFTHKKPKMTGAMEIRPKIEIELTREQFDEIFDMYQDRGTKIIKDREIYTLDGVTVNLDTPLVARRGSEDDVLFSGQFLELKIEGGLPNEEKIKGVCKKLGLPYDKRITSSYPDYKGVILT